MGKSTNPRVRLTKPITYKICFIGSSGCGKTSLIDVANGGPFRENVPPTRGADLVPINKKDKEIPYQLYIWDVAGESNYVAFSTRNADLHELVVDVSNLQKSLDNLKILYSSINIDPVSKPRFFLIGNKIDAYLEKFPAERHAQL